MEQLEQKIHAILTKILPEWPYFELRDQWSDDLNICTHTNIHNLYYERQLAYVFPPLGGGLERDVNKLRLRLRLNEKLNQEKITME